MCFKFWLLAAILKSQIFGQNPFFDFQVSRGFPPLSKVPIEIWKMSII